MDWFNLDLSIIKKSLRKKGLQYIIVRPSKLVLKIIFVFDGIEFILRIIKCSNIVPKFVFHQNSPPWYGVCMFELVMINSYLEVSYMRPL